MKPKVLIIEDERTLQDAYHSRLDDQLEIFSAYTVAEAQQIFQDHPDLAAIAVDACLTGDIPDTINLIREFSRSFHGPMIAISSRSDYRYLQQDAGCNAECEKHVLPRLLRQLLKI